jgi:N-acetylmuramoyl-L-alanine amidase
VARGRFLVALSATVALVLAATPLAQSVRPALPYTVFTSDARKMLAGFTAGDQELVRLDDVAAMFQVQVREDRGAKALTVSAGSRTVVLSLDQGLASIGGRLVSLPAPPTRDGNRWLVPADFVGRALPLVLDKRVELRKSSRLIIVGDVRVPRVVIRPELVGAATRVTLDVTPRAEYTIVQDPHRLTVKFEADALDAATAASSVGLVEQVGLSEPANVVLSLAQGHGAFRASTVPVDAASSRIVIDVMPAGVAGVSPVPATPQPQAPAPAEPVTPPPPMPGASGPALRTVVIDPGHGGDEQGARGPAGTLEKDLTLDVARRLKGTLESRLGIRVLLTRDDDRTVALDERGSMANNNKADLFISLHANASPRAEARGAEVFYLSLDGFTDETRRAAENPQSVVLPTVGGGSRDVQMILWEMAQARHLAESAVFAGFVEEALRAHVEMSQRPIQQAPFRVLVAANMPAVLVEMAFLSNPDQETQLTSDAFKTQVVQSLFDAVLRYRARLEGAKRP